MDADTLNRLYNPWPIIDTYFRDIKYYKSQHQVDSFDEFITSEDNGIRKIIKRNNPFTIWKGETSENNFDYEIQIYFGETLDEATGEIVKGVDNIFITSPIIYDNDTKKISICFRMKRD